MAGNELTLVVEVKEGSEFRERVLAQVAEAVEGLRGLIEQKDLEIQQLQSTLDQIIPDWGEAPDWADSILVTSYWQNRERAIAGWGRKKPAVGQQELLAPEKVEVTRQLSKRICALELSRPAA